MLGLLIALCEAVPEPDWVGICQCHMFLDNAAEVANILRKLLQGSEVRLPAGLCAEAPAMVLDRTSGQARQAADQLLRAYLPYIA